VGQCAVCFLERKRAAGRMLRRLRLRGALRTAGVVTCLAASGLAAVGAALLPEPAHPVDADVHLLIVARGELRFVGDAVERWADEHGQTCPPSLSELRREGFLLAAPNDPWGEPLLFGCVEGPRAFVVMSKGPDREAGTDDDLMFAAP
jgi:hypothetical protein